MKTFIRENPTISFGLGLPLLLVLLFLFISWVPSLLVKAPQHDLIYATDYQQYQLPLQISVVDQKVQVFHQGIIQGGRQPQLWRYSPATGAVKEIPIILSAAQASAGDGANTQSMTPVDVPDLAGLTVDSSSVAPDGYRFSTGSDRASRNIFGGLFYSSRYRYEAILIKDGRRIKLPHAAYRSYYGNTKFVGWVIAE